MDDSDFAAWLTGIARLTVQQRGEGFRALALAEAVDGPNPAGLAPADLATSVPLAIDAPGNVGPGGVLACTEDVTADAGSVALMSETVSLTVAAQRKVDRTGCPHCGCRRLQGWGHASGLPRYRCVDCRRSFNALTGTPLARLRLKEKWAAQTEALITGESLVKAAERCGVAVTTAFRWRHRFLSAPALDKPANSPGLLKPTRPLFWNRSRANAPRCHVPLASVAVKRANAVCQPSRFRSWSRATGAGKPRTRCWPNSTGPRSPRHSPVSSRRKTNSVAMAEKRS